MERAMRSSSISSQGYSYAKTTGLRGVPANPPPSQVPPSSSSDQPLSPHHYNHLRSRSGPPIAPQLLPLSAQLEQHQKAGSQPLSLHHQQPPLKATTRLDEDSDSLVVVQRQMSMPAMSAGHYGGLNRTNSSFDSGISSKHGKIEKLDDLAGVLDDLAKITQELDEDGFPGLCGEFRCMCVVCQTLDKKSRQFLKLLLHKYIASHTAYHKLVHSMKT